MGLETLLVSALTGLALLATVAFVTSGRQWRDYSPVGEEGSLVAALADLAHSPAVWAIGFLVVVLGIGGAALAFVDGGSSTLALVGVAVLGVVGALLLVFYLLYGTFSAARARGLENSHAAAVVAWVVGLASVVVVVAKLLGVF